MSCGAAVSARVRVMVGEGSEGTAGGREGASGAVCVREGVGRGLLCREGAEVDDGDMGGVAVAVAERARLFVWVAGEVWWRSSGVPGARAWPCVWWEWAWAW